MFTIEQIKEAHSKVRSGADFPGYIQELKQLGVTEYTTYVGDGHTDFVGTKGYKVTWPAKYDALDIAETPNATKFVADLRAHQQGQSDYMTFCNQAAAAGVEMWNVCMDEMDCIYYDRERNEVFAEAIPQ